MRKITLLLFFMSLFLSIGLQAQLPNIPNTDYSTRSGTATDSRDGKQYAYKKYGNKDWFIQNLNYEGNLSVAHPGDPTGEKYGRLYQSNPGSAINTWCPEGWVVGTESAYQDLFNSMITEYDIIDVEINKHYPVSGQTEPYYFLEIGKYLLSGGVQGADADGQWLAGTVIDTKAKQIGFNTLPAGVYNKNTNSFGAASGQGRMTIDDRVGSMASFLLGGYYNYFVSPTSKITSGGALTGNAVVWQGRSSYLYASARCYRPHAPEFPIVTPYVEELTISQIVSAEKEKDRLKQIMKKYDHTLTGFYLPAGKTLKVNLETLQASADGRKPQVVIGTYGLVNPSNLTEHQPVKSVDLNEGLNTIEGTATGGMVHFRYVSDTDAPQGKVKVTLAAGSEHVRAPHFVYGTSSKDEFKYMLNAYDNSREAMFSSDETVIITTRSAAISQIETLDIDYWIKGIHHMLDEEDKISGQDNNDSNPLHHRLKKGEIRHLLTHCKDGSPHATDWYTGYPRSSQPQLLSQDYLWKNRGWGLGHELGHQHQQSAYRIPQAGESTVNIYSYVAARFFAEQRGESWDRTPAAKWSIAQGGYLTLPLEDRLYEMPDDDLNAINGPNLEKNELRFMPWEQMFIMFGDDFYKRLHRIVREENATGSGEESKVYLIWKSSQITGYDLRPFFAEWGIKVLDEYKKVTMDKQFEKANLPLHPNTPEMHLITGQNRPSWVPIAMTGITSSSPENNADAYVMPTNFADAVNNFVDYSTKKGTVTDTRDGNQYHYKQYGNTEWFMQNLRYDTDDNNTKTSTFDTEGEYLGRYYKSYTPQTQQEGWCPTGWTVATRNDYRTLFNAIVDEYNLDDVTVVSNPKEGAAEFLNIGKYLKAGGFQSQGGLWEDPWKEIILIDQAKVDAIGFNALPVGVWNSNGGYPASSDKGTDDRIGKMANFLTRGGNTWDNYYMSSIDTQNSIIYQGRGSAHYASVRCVRSAQTMIDQSISLENIIKNLSDADFAPAQASSGLPVTYSSSDESVATIVDGNIHLVGAGEATLTASQAGDATYNAAPDVSCKLTVIDNTDTSIHELYVNGKPWNIADKYIVDCDENSSELIVDITTADNARVVDGNPIRITMSEPSQYKVNFTVEAASGATQVYTLNVEKLSSFDDFVINKCNTFLIVNNNVFSNGGQLFTSFNWYKDDVLMSRKPYYIPIGQNGSGNIRLEATTLKGKVVRTCSKYISLENEAVNVYPNPTRPGQTVKVEVNLPEELLKGATIKIYNILGFAVRSARVTGSETYITMPILPGVYLMKVKATDFVADVRLLVK